MSLKNRGTCPCCGYKTVNFKKTFPICRICQWQYCEDTLIDSSDITCNGITLKEGQLSFIEFGVSKNSDMYIAQQHEVKDTDIKDPEWRCINESDIFLNDFSKEEEKEILASINWEDYESYCYWNPENIFIKEKNHNQKLD